MKTLPPTLLRAPTLLYGAAVLMFFWSFAQSYYEVTSLAFVYAEGGDPVSRLTLIKAAYQAVLEALYLAATGATIHVLLAIWARLDTTYSSELPE